MTSELVEQLNYEVENQVPCFEKVLDVVPSISPNIKEGFYFVCGLRDIIPRCIPWILYMFHLVYLSFYGKE